MQGALGNTNLRCLQLGKLKIYLPLVISATQQSHYQRDGLSANRILLLIALLAVVGCSWLLIGLVFSFCGQYSSCGMYKVF